MTALGLFQESRAQATLAALKSRLALSASRRHVEDRTRCRVGHGRCGETFTRWLGCAPSVILAVRMVFLPETQRWLASRGYADKAKAALRRLRGRNADIDVELDS
jgi:hypothetical protein